ncbi:MAG: cytochrome c [Deltaproteobacteria bacterium]|nr:cytochrome c [Deltaproteobacteria bacterium]
MKMRIHVPGILSMSTSLAAAALLGACAPTSGGTPPRSAAVPKTVESQVAEGKALYGQRCAGCHGDGGQGTDKAPALVGAGALPLDPPAERKFRKTQFKTALDVADFVVPNMPPPPKEKLTEEQYWSVLAFDLQANGVALKESVGPDNAAALVLHP